MHKRCIVQCLRDGTPVREYGSVKEAQEACSGATHISQCCRKKRKTDGGYVWRYREEMPDVHIPEEGEAFSADN
ncbi:MAG: hypothetical protein ACI4DT_09820 [Chordicoccus sp.]